MHKVTMLDIALEAGVSKNTVSLALRNDPQVSPKTREAIEKIALRLGYTRNALVSHLMAQLRADNSSGYKATLALVNAYEDRNAFCSHPTIPTYVEGCQRKARQCGYHMDQFWLHDPELNAARFNTILRTRGIRGIVIVGLMYPDLVPESRLPTWKNFQKFLPTWENFPCIVTGVRSQNPALSFACCDHHILVMRAVENALRIGYRRPALVLDGVIDRLVEYRFSSGYYAARRQFHSFEKVEPFYKVAEAKENPSLFQKWFYKQKPDVILTLYHGVRRWLHTMKLDVPNDVGLIQLEWRPDHADWAGMHQHNDIVGEAAVQMLIEMIHNNERGAPPFPRANFIGSSWVDGGTVREQNLSNAQSSS